MSLNKILEEIKKVKPFVDEEVLEQPRETLGGRMSRQKRAREQMKSLGEQYAQELMRSSAFILVSGEGADEFAKTAEGFFCFTANSKDFYQDLADRVAPVLYEGKESSSNLFEVVTRHLEDKAGELGILGYPQMIFRQQYRRVLTNKEDLVNVLKQAINEQVGAEVIGIQAIRSIVDKAIARDHNAKMTPIVLTIAAEDVGLAESALRRLTPHVTSVESKGGETKNQIKHALKAANAHFLGKVYVAGTDADEETSDAGLPGTSDSIADGVANVLASLDTQATTEQDVVQASAPTNKNKNKNKNKQ